MILSSLTEENLPAALGQIETAGHLHDWCLAASNLFAPGCEAQAFVLLASFASPLLGMIRMGDGGALVSLFGGKGSGKTIAYEAAQSVWGDRPLALSTLLGDARLARLAELETLPALHDRLAHADASRTNAFLETVFMSDNKARKPWHGLMLSFSTMPILPQIDDAPIGVEFEVKVPKALIAPRKPSASDPLAYEFAGNHGHAGRAFVQYMAHEPKRNWARHRLISDMSEINERLGLGRPERFVTRAIAAVNVAAIVVQRIGLVDFEPERIKTWAERDIFGDLVDRPLS